MKRPYSPPALRPFASVSDVELLLADFFKRGAERWRRFSLKALETP